VDWFPLLPLPAQRVTGEDSGLSLPGRLRAFRQEPIATVVSSREQIYPPTVNLQGELGGAGHRSLVVLAWPI
jgi:hypothetical protein